MSEYLSKAAAFAQNAAKLSKKVSEGIVENAREFGLEATSSGHYFDTSEEKMRDIKRQLDSRHDREKMDGLKRLIAMISKGRDVSEFFPDVVKNVASQNLEIRKLVYIYLLRYAEQEPDLALLSINTFQRDLTDQNQLIRAMALRVMSGIRVPVISPIVLLAIKKCMTDLSAYVRKTAAHAIPKCYSLDPSQKDALVDVITTLLNDNSPFTIGSVITAFNEVCPDRLDLIHLHYRKLCRMLIDADEWGQIAIMGLLLRYARTQFLNPNPDNNRVSQKKKSKAFYSDEDSDDSDNSLDNSYALDPDHEQLLRDSLPLLQSRNSAVVLSVAKIFYHLAPTADAYKISKPLIRLLHSHREIQYVVLANIATMATQRPYLFEPHLQQFFVRSTDAVFIRNLKMEIMTLVATESNITGILRELQVYPNKDFATSAIRAIGRCAIGMPDMAESCLNGLMKLLWSKNDAVVAESVVVIKRLLQLRPKDNADMIIQLAKALDHITVPMARASIFWLVGQYSQNLEKVAPDILRKAAKTFTAEADVVKLQIINLGAKLLSLHSTDHTLNLLFQYVLNLARYDLNYDIRDRARLLRGLILINEKKDTHMNNMGVEGVEEVMRSEESSKSTILMNNLKRILLCEKEAPSEESPSVGRDRFIIGSMSLVLNYSVPGYKSLPDWPTKKPDGSVRDNLDDTWNRNQYIKGFGSDSFGQFVPSSTYDKLPVKQRNETYDSENFYDFYESSDDNKNHDEKTEESSEAETSEEE
ncbi:878_t:CDS:10 [Cetraspora pellucida]|uniref:878_t:CDS:1 n=2 Tax=Cetraspora pellucida TaxID=1433469 RepID=A0A9N8VWV8_9GLOM|nr:878_t:CDS:10 [Cetraspora pellucida]